MKTILRFFDALRVNPAAAAESRAKQARRYLMDAERDAIVAKHSAALYRELVQFYEARQA